MAAPASRAAVVSASATRARGLATAAPNSASPTIADLATQAARYHPLSEPEAVTARAFLALARFYFN